VNTLEGRVALITGASSGIGSATARALSAAGARVALGSRREDDLGIDGALAQACDVRDPKQIEELAAAAADRFGRLDIVVANAGVGAYGDFLSLDPDHLEEIADAVVHCVTRPRTHRVLEATILPMSDDSMN